MKKMMKSNNIKLIVGAFAAACVLTGLAEKRGETATNEEDITARVEGALSGGLIIKPYTGKTIHIVNLQKKFKTDAFCAVVERIRLETALPVYAITNSTAANAKAAIAEEMTKHNAAFVLVVTNDKGKSTILSAPEDCWCVLNLAKLASDFPSDKRFADRATKELWRAFMYTMGVGHSMYKPCLMKPVNGVNDLDQTPMMQPGPEPFNKAQDAAAKMGVGKIKIATYRTACIEGWAPPPDDPERKIVWEQIKAEKNQKPTNPMKITKPTAQK